MLAVADDTSAELAVRQAEANLAAAKAQKKTDTAGGTATSRSQAKDQVTSAKTQLSSARSSYSSTVAQNNLKLRQARQAVTDAKAQYKSDKASGAPQQTLDQDKKAITAAEQNLASTKLQAAAGNRQAANQVTSAKQSLASANRGYKTATTSADDATIIADDVAIAEAEQALADAETALEMATITAPIDGRITVVNAVVGQESTGTAIQLQSTRMALTVSVTEDDILDLAVGQKATVAISATGDTAVGTVTAVSPVASTSGSSTVVSYSVVVTLDESTGTTAATGSDAPAVASAASSPAPTSAAPLPGMSAEITIVIAEADDALAVPAIALSGTSGGYTVRVLNSDGSVEARSVDVGLIASDYAQITGGLAEGEAVVTGSSADRTSTSSSSHHERSRRLPRPRRRRSGSSRGSAPGRRLPGAAMSGMIIDLTEATRTYDLGRVQVHALEGASLQVADGEFVAIIGPSGSGKSTLMNILGCLDRPTSGQYILDGADVEELDDDGLAEVRSRMIGFVFQNFNLLPRTTALENVAMPLLYQGVPKKERLAARAGGPGAVGLGDRLDHEPSELSGGQQQRVAIARALVTNPRLILADEPTGNLDSHTGEEVLQLFHDLNDAGATIVLITHDSDVAVRATRQVHVRDGRIAA